MNEFKALYEGFKTGVEWVDHLIYSALYFLEELVIKNRVKVEVDEAIKTVELPHPPDLVSPVYSESPSKESERLPEMRLTAPWYVSPHNDVEGR